MQDWVYRKSGLYEYHFKELREKRWDDFQTSMDLIGVLDPTGIVDGLNAIGYLARGQNTNAMIAAVGIVPYIGDLGKLTKYTKSSLKMGQEMHKAYKVAEEAAGLGIKEFREIPGIRPDFVDMVNRTIYELKPFNPRAMKAGEKQLAKYKAAFEAAYPWHNMENSIRYILIYNNGKERS
ncbi:hypothetical protein H9W95_01155 [Flavobacterium lindanitolerans]|nr:hypothetical protein [Flavobacterium lindanitolerans]